MKNFNLLRKSALLLSFIIACSFISVQDKTPLFQKDNTQHKLTEINSSYSLLLVTYKVGTTEAEKMAFRQTYGPQLGMVGHGWFPCPESNVKETWNIPSNIPGTTIDAAEDDDKISKIRVENVLYSGDVSSPCFN